MGGLWSVVDEDKNNDNRQRRLAMVGYSYCSVLICQCCFSGYNQEQPVEGLLVCVDLLRVHKTTQWLITQSSIIQ